MHQMFHFLVSLRIQTPPENLVGLMVSTSHPRIGFFGGNIPDSKRTYPWTAKIHGKMQVLVFIPRNMGELNVITGHKPLKMRVSRGVPGVRRIFGPQKFIPKYFFCICFAYFFFLHNNMQKICQKKIFSIPQDLSQAKILLTLGSLDPPRGGNQSDKNQGPVRQKWMPCPSAKVVINWH